MNAEVAECLICKVLTPDCMTVTCPLREGPIKVSSALLRIDDEHQVVYPFQYECTDQPQERMKLEAKFLEFTKTCEFPTAMGFHSLLWEQGDVKLSFEYVRTYVGAESVMQEVGK